MPSSSLACTQPGSKITLQPDIQEQLRGPDSGRLVVGPAGAGTAGSSGNARQRSKGESESQDVETKGGAGTHLGQAAERKGKGGTLQGAEWGSFNRQLLAHSFACRSQDFPSLSNCERPLYA